MPDLTRDLPPSPPTSGSGPAIDPSSTAVPAVPRPTAPAPPSATSSPWLPHFEMPAAAAAAAVAGAGPASTGPAKVRRRATLTRTRAVVGGTSVAAFLAIVAAVGVHGGSQPASVVSAGNDGSTTGLDPGLVRPNLGQSPSGNGSGSVGSSSRGPFGSSSGGAGASSGAGSGTTSPFSGGLSGGFSATPGTGRGSAQTRSHGS